MKARVIGALSIALVMLHGPVRAQRQPPLHPDLQGRWIGATMTPLQRPAEFKDQAAFTPEEAVEYIRASPERVRNGLPTLDDRLTQVDLDDIYVETEVMKLDGLRTSLIVDPPNGILPPLRPAALVRAAARPKRSFDDPEVLGMAERCLLGNFGAGGSTASPPMVPSPVIPLYYEIVQTDAYVLIFAEWIHDARIVRMNSTHLSAGDQKMARRFDRLLGRVHAGGGHDQFSV